MPGPLLTFSKFFSPCLRAFRRAAHISSGSRLQDAPKTAPRRPKRRPRGAQDAPRGPKTPPRRPPMKPYEALLAPTEPYRDLRSPTRPYGALRGPTEPYEALGSPTELRSPINFTGPEPKKRSSRFI